MTTLLLLLLCLIAAAIHFRPDLLHKVKTTYLRPEISIFELIILVIIGLLLVTW